MTLNLDNIRNILHIFIQRKSPDYELSMAGYNHLLQIASLKQFKIKTGLPEEYQPGMPLPAQVVNFTTKLSEDVRPFKVSMGEGDFAPLMVNILTGFADIPIDMYYPLSMSYKYVLNSIVKKKKINVVTDENWDDKISSSIMFPTLKKPIANFQSSYIRFYPVNVQYVNFVYLRYPLDPVFAYEYSLGYNKYDPAKSVELEWNEMNKIDIISIMLGMIGINVERGDVVQLADKMRKEGI